MKAKNLLPILIVLISIPSHSQDRDGRRDFDFENKYIDDLAQAKRNFRINLAKFIDANATKIEILKLGTAITKSTLQEADQPTRYFMVEAGGGMYHHVVKSKVWVGDDLKNIKELITGMVRDSDLDVVLDHQAEYGLRVYFESRVILSTSLSLKSENWYLMYPENDISYEWLSLTAAEFKKWVP